MDYDVDQAEEAFRKYYVAKSALHDIGVDVSSESTIDHQFEELMSIKQRR
jgi:hypothetical protein